MTMTLATTKGSNVREQILVVGNFLGATTVQGVPRVNDRLQSVSVQLGDAVRKAQGIAVDVVERTRLRPLLMTSVATMLGAVPMALGIGEGPALQAPLARVVIGGLLASTLITFGFVPTVYTLFEEGWKGLRSGYVPEHS